MTRCGLSKLSDNIFLNHKQLETLNLGINELNELNCEAFNGLESLKVLNLRYNDLKNFDLTNLSEVLAKLTGLEKLNLLNNKIVNLETIANRLTEMNIIFVGN